MAQYLLSYDLVKKKDYQTLYSELDKFNAVRVLESVWCFNRFNTNAEGLRNHFKKFVDPDDRFIVTEVTNWAGRNLIGTPNDLK